MAETILVKPGTGRRVRLSRRQVLHDGKAPAQGTRVALTTFVRRRLLFGDLVEVPAEPTVGVTAPPRATAPAQGAQ
jgi:hypothetical protein